MTGTIFSVTEAMRLMPPMKMKAATRATMRPTSHVGVPRAELKASLMELDWTMMPMKPRARMMAIAKKVARPRPSLPLKASWM